MRPFFIKIHYKKKAMVLDRHNLAFLQYDAKYTEILRHKWTGKNDKDRALLMKEIDEDYQPLREDICLCKKPRIGDEYQVALNDAKL